jgi:hypothetical protein
MIGIGGLTMHAADDVHVLPIERIKLDAVA